MKIERLFGITMMLLSRRRVNAQTLAEKFEVSHRTIYRDLDTINAAGIPIVAFTGNDGGYEIMEQFRIDRQIVTLEDLQSILSALKGVRASLDDEEMDDLLTRIKALISRSEQKQLEETGETLIFDTNLWHGGGIKDRTILVQLRQASRNRTVVSFTYTNTEGTHEHREVEPIGLAWKGYAWYLYAYCKLRGDYRTFRLSRLTELRVHLEYFASRGVRMEELDTRWGNQETGSVVELQLLFRPRLRVRVEEAFGPANVEVRDDGSLLVRASCPDNHWMYGMILSYGPDVKVLEPAFVADKIKRMGTQITSLYE
ncbi:Predicted DNA-binding transcriptional regulator YafY, contains an HTH and WYL domains [Paenibacillus sp. UNC496MF]|uniref:helix-turn-helix transcriptional regulator n=1 Tax=Paenibacillus sp. UNC496MF TaxID=1502753 RepID=UPI0008E1CA63|nr:YafY family protein [Paenibacillus sp. UNC496MF]SFJ76159.1 Predicted DNA-binding transcriptional regulator YafY, contains an HTH and WYL domains [Paenibacillus sp. UNC496MF]